MGGTSELVSELFVELSSVILIVGSLCLVGSVFLWIRAQWSRLLWDRVFGSQFEIAPDLEEPEADPDSETDEELVIWIDDDHI